MSNSEEMMKTGTLSHFIQRGFEKDEVFLENLSGGNFDIAQKKLYELSGIFAIRLKHCMNEWNYKQKDLIEKTGISKSTISKYLRGKEFPSVNNIDKIAEIFGIPSLYFLGLTNCVSFEEYYSLNVEKVIGISENAAKSLWSIKYCLEELTGFPFINGDDFETKEEMTINKENLDAFNLFVADRSNFLDFIMDIEKYMKILKETKDSKEVNPEETQKLLELEQDIIKTIRKSLNSIVNNIEEE